MGVNQEKKTKQRFIILEQGFSTCGSPNKSISNFFVGQASGSQPGADKMLYYHGWVQIIEKIEKY